MAKPKRSRRPKRAPRPCNPNNLYNETVRLPPDTRERADSIANAATSAAKGMATVTRMEVLRRAVVLGLSELAREYGVQP